MPSNLENYTIYFIRLKVSVCLYIVLLNILVFNKMCSIAFKRGLMAAGLGGSLGSGHCQLPLSQIFSQRFSRNKWSCHCLLWYNHNNIFGDVFEMGNIFGSVFHSSSPVDPISSYYLMLCDEPHKF